MLSFYRSRASKVTHYTSHTMQLNTQLRYKKRETSYHNIQKDIWRVFDCVLVYGVTEPQIEIHWIKFW